ncbi:MAG: hypothetical protein AB7O24_13735 [Kofleriaceae bacterium]
MTKRLTTIATLELATVTGGAKSETHRTSSDGRTNIHVKNETNIKHGKYATATSVVIKDKDKEQGGVPKYFLGHRVA